MRQTNYWFIIINLNLFWFISNDVYTIAGCITSIERIFHFEHKKKLNDNKLSIDM